MIKLYTETEESASDVFNQFKKRKKEDISHFSDEIRFSEG